MHWSKDQQVSQYVDRFEFICPRDIEYWWKVNTKILLKTALFTMGV